MIHTNMPHDTNKLYFQAHRSLGHTLTDEDISMTDILSPYGWFHSLTNRLCSDAGIKKQKQNNTLFFKLRQNTIVELDI